MTPNSEQPIWAAISALARAWERTPVFNRFKGELPRNCEQHRVGVPHILQLVESGGGHVESRPLRVVAILPRMLEAMKDDLKADLKAFQAPFLQWAEAAEAVAAAHYDTIAWLRSRLPGYPGLWAPQLTPGTSYTTDEFSWLHQWRPGERSRGLQTDDAPPRSVTQLAASSDQAKELNAAAKELAKALRQSAEWVRFDDALRSLDDVALAKLKQLRASLSRRVSPEAIDAHEPSLLLERHAYRDHVTKEEIGTLAGIEREYTDAFGAANDLLEHAASDVFGQLAAYGEPSTVSGITDLSFRPGEIAFVVEEAALIQAGSIVWVDDGLVPDAVQITHITINFHQATGMQQRIDARLLAGTASVWRK